MTKEIEVLQVPSKVAVTIISVLLSGAIAFNAWAVSSMYERPTREVVAEMIEDKSPYTRDRSMILRVLDDIHSELSELKELLREQRSGTNQ